MSKPISTLLYDQKPVLATAQTKPEPEPEEAKSAILNNAIQLPELPNTELSLCFYDESGWVECNGKGYEAHQMEAYAETAVLKDREARAKSEPAVRVPLTDEQMRAMQKNVDPVGDWLCTWTYRKGIRDAEQAHGIPAPSAEGGA